jgi:hypothetical protein
MDCEINDGIAEDGSLEPFEGDFSTSFIDGDECSYFLSEGTDFLPAGEWIPFGGERSFTDGDDITFSSYLGCIGFFGGEL